MTHIWKVLRWLCKAELQASFEKCKFNITCTKFLEFIVSLDGIEVDPAKTSIIKDWSCLKTVKEVQSFLGFCNFYRQFIKDYSWIAKPLNCLTHANQSFEWGSTSELTFEALKGHLLSTPILAHYSLDQPTKVKTDALNGVVCYKCRQTKYQDALDVVDDSEESCDPQNPGQ